MIPGPDIPGHCVTGVLGSGGFATVYRTWQVAVGRETAVKVERGVRTYRCLAAPGGYDIYERLFNIIP